MVARERRRPSAGALPVKSVAGPGVKLELQLASTAAHVPSRAFFAECAAAALRSLRRRAELTVRVVDRAESRALNRRWRGIDRATNVLSFPLHGLDAIAPDLLGDIVICAPLVASEAAAQMKPVTAHWAHMTVHGVLHLLDFDHVRAAEAVAMEERERAVLARLGYPDPYLVACTS